MSKNLRLPPFLRQANLKSGKIQIKKIEVDVGVKFRGFYLKALIFSVK